MTALLIASLIASPVPPGWLDALALVESGNNPHAVGCAGERTEWQVCPRIWHAHTRTPMHRAGSNMRRGVVSEEWGHRINLFTIRHGRKPTPREAHLLWHRPARVFNPKPKELERARRFENLVRMVR